MLNIEYDCNKEPYYYCKVISPKDYPLGQAHYPDRCIYAMPVQYGVQNGNRFLTLIQDV